MATEGTLLLKKLKIWDTYGSSGWSIAGLIKSNILQRNRSKGTEIRYNLSLPQVVLSCFLSQLRAKWLFLSISIRMTACFVETIRHIKLTILPSSSLLVQLPIDLSL
jgi:hypothetical protein